MNTDSDFVADLFQKLNWFRTVFFRKCGVREDPKMKLILEFENHSGVMSAHHALCFTLEPMILQDYGNSFREGEDVHMVFYGINIILTSKQKPWNRLLPKSVDYLDMILLRHQKTDGKKHA